MEKNDLQKYFSATACTILDLSKQFVFLHYFLGSGK